MKKTVCFHDFTVYFFVTNTNPLIEPTMAGTPAVQIPAHYFHNNPFPSKHLKSQNYLDQPSILEFFAAEKLLSYLSIIDILDECRFI